MTIVCERGHHIYKDVWVPDPMRPEVLTCVRERETGNDADPYSVAMVNSSVTIVGHVPHKISSICSVFLLRGGLIKCEINGHRRYSSDHPQGGLELPCLLTFVGSPVKIEKVRALLKDKCLSDTESAKASPVAELTDPPSKKPKIQGNEEIINNVAIMFGYLDMDIPFH